MLFKKILWKEKPPRINRSKLMLDRNKGGLGLPDVYKYYNAFNARYPLTWAYKREHNHTAWENIEQDILLMNKCPLSLKSLWNFPKYQEYMKNPILQFSCKIASILHNTVDFDGMKSPQTPLWNNGRFFNNGKPFSNKEWETKGINNISDLLDDAHQMRSFQQLKDKFSLSNKDFLVYL